MVLTWALRSSATVAVALFVIALGSSPAHATQADEPLFWDSSLASVCNAPGAAIFSDSWEVDVCRWTTARPDPGCPAPICGDAMQGVGEGCDDGNMFSETECPYGTATCKCCSSDCSGYLALTGHRCGDGNADFAFGEVCDDGNQITETQCPYGLGTCNACSADCQTSLALVGPYCGDGNLDGSSGEVCDDRNSSACGTCNAQCSAVQQAAATGFILTEAAIDLGDPETFTVGDGFGSTVTFEFDKGGDGVSPGNAAVVIGSFDTSSQVAAKMADAISSSTLQVDALSFSNLVQLAHQLQSSLGNVPLLETVGDEDFFVSGMAGGKGGDCGTGVGCAHDADCASFDCSFGICQ